MPIYYIFEAKTHNVAGEEIFQDEVNGLLRTTLVSYNNRYLSWLLNVEWIHRVGKNGN